METWNEISAEINQISPAVANIGKRTLYSVPPGYFQTLLPQILDKIDRLSAEERKETTPYQVPAGYFEELSGNILSRIKSSAGSVPGNQKEGYRELEEVAPFLNTLSKSNVYSIPDGFFDSFGVPAPALETPQTVMVRFGSKFRRTIYYAAAACVIGIAALTVTILISRSKTPVAVINRTTAPVLNGINLPDSLASLSDNAIASYLDNQPTAFDLITPPVTGDTPDVNDLLTNTSDDEILQYLRENADPGPKKIKGI